ncbi:MAG: cadherin-like domain-containing protein [Williamsia herbipolensis]|nr:cadherin-like domain-containing protein [Williamsia herbipolensis]
MTGSLGVRDADGDPLTFTVVEQPGTGTVTLDQTAGTYTFTPTAAARRVAAGTVEVDTVTFTVMVSDGEGGETPVEVTVAVDPGPAEVVAALPVGQGVQSLYGSPDGRRIYAVGSGAPTASTLAAARGFSALDASAPDDATTAGSTLSIIDAGSNTLISSVTLPGRPDELRFSPDGSHAFVTTHAGETRLDQVTVTVIDVDSDVVVASVEAETYFGVYFDPAGRHAYLGDYMGGRVTILDLQDDSTTTLAVPPMSGNLLFTPNGRRAYVQNYADNTITVIDPTDHTIVDTLAVRGYPQLGPDGRYLYVLDYGYDSGTLTVIDSETDAVSAVIPVGAYPSTPQFGAGDRYAFVLNTYGDAPRNLTVIDTADHSVTTIGLRAGASLMQLSSDGRRGYIVDRDEGSVTVVDTAHGVLVSTVDTTDYSFSNIRDAAFSPDGSRFYVADIDKLTIINTVDDSVTIVPGNARLGFVPDGSAAYLLGYGDADGATLQLVSTADDSIRTFSVPVAYADSVFFDPGTTRAYFRGGDGVLTVLNLTDGATTGDCPTSGVTGVDGSVGA